MSLILPTRFGKPSGPPTVIGACDTPVSSFIYSDKSKLTFSNDSVTLDWSPTGEFMWIGLKTGRTALNYIGATNWDIPDRNSPNNYRYGFIPEINSGGSVWSMLITTAPDGTPGGQMLLNLAFGLGICKIAQYTLPIPFEVRQGLSNPDISQGAPYYDEYTPVFVGSYLTTANTASDSVNDMRMSPDGTRIIASTFVSTGKQTLVQWNLTVPYDVLGGMAFQPIVHMDGYNPASLYIPPSGKCVYLTQAGTIYQFVMDTPWELSSLNMTPADSLDVSAQNAGSITSVYATETDLYVLGAGNGDMYQYSPVAPPNIWPSADDYEYDNKESSVIQGQTSFISFNPSGTKLVSMRGQFDPQVAEFDVTTAWDISTVDFGTRTLNSNWNVHALACGHWSNDGGYFFGVNDPGTTGQFLHRFTAASAFSTVGGAAGISVNIDSFFPVSGPLDSIYVKNDGTALFINTRNPTNTDDMIQELTMSTPWDITTLALGAVRSPFGGSSFGIWFQPDGMRIYTLGGPGYLVRSWPLTTAWDITTMDTSTDGLLDSRPYANTCSCSFFREDGKRLYLWDFGSTTIEQFKEIGT